MHTTKRIAAALLLAASAASLATPAMADDGPADLGFDPGAVVLPDRISPLEALGAEKYLELHPNGHSPLGSSLLK